VKKLQHDAASKENSKDFEIVHVPGPYFTPQELDSLIDLVARMIVDDLHARMNRLNQSGGKDDTGTKT
jgi:hypothetical protein